MRTATLLLAISASLVGANRAAAAGPKPNIVALLADHLGYGDVGCFGAKDIQTPNIDSPARDGMKFTDFDVHQRCSPSRLSFMTGYCAHRVGTTKVGETRNVAAEHPEIVRSLRARADAFQKELTAHSRPIGRLDDVNKPRSNLTIPVPDQ